jgi:hypothetical protein
MPDAIPHLSHRSALSWSVGGLDRDRPPLCGIDPFGQVSETLSTSLSNVRDHDVTSHCWVLGGRSSEVWEVSVEEGAWAGISNVGRKGCVRISTHERDRTGASSQPPSACCLLGRVCGHRLRLAASPVRPTRIPGWQARPLSTVGCRPLDRRPDRDDFSRQSVSLSTGRTV